MSEPVCECANCWLSYHAQVGLECLRERDVQAMGAAISRRNWHDLEAAYNQVRDGLDRILAIVKRASPSKKGRVLNPPQIPPFISVPDFDDRSEERACINGCLYLRADCAAKLWEPRHD